MEWIHLKPRTTLSEINLLKRNADCEAKMILSNILFHSISQGLLDKFVDHVTETYEPKAYHPFGFFPFEIRVIKSY